MKDYEGRTKQFLPRRTYTLFRLDGKAFHTFTRSFKRPYDSRLMQMMDETAIALCKGIQGAKFAYVQSDEISILATDFETPTTDAWFDQNVQKMTSISAAIATNHFNNMIWQYKQGSMFLEEEERLSDDVKPNALFDSRVWTVSDREEVVNTLIWRQQDATRNSIQMSAQSMYSHKELHGKDTNELQEMIFQKGINWNDYPVGFKRGRFIKKVPMTKPISVPNRPELAQVVRNEWVVDEPPIFTQERSYLLNLIPVIGAPSVIES